MKRLFILLILVSPVLADGAKTVTWSRDIAPVVYQNCVSCHREGQVAPFSLQAYDDAKKRADQLAEVTASKFMPPWKAESGVGSFVGERHLTDAQIALFKTWAQQGTPQGDPKEAPKLPKFADGWQLGEPDLVVKVDQPYTLKADGRDEYRCFVVPLNLSEDKYVTAVEFRPSNRKIVHHAILYLDTNGRARKLDAADPGVGYRRVGGPGFTPTGSLGGWAPGAFVTPLPDGVARLVKKGSDLVIQTHFHPSGKTETEQSSVGIYFAKKPVEKQLAGLALRNRNIDIPAGEKNYTVTDSLELPVNVDLLGLTPHAHLLCKDMRAWAVLPDGKKLDLIHVADWDFNWQEQYQLKNPLHLPAGTTLHMKYVYDNSADNLNNPSNPPQRVRFGEETVDEMAFLFINVIPEKKGDQLALLAAMLKHRQSRED